MKFLIEPYIRNRTEDLLFLQINRDAIKVKDYTLPEDGLFAPLMTNELANNIKTKSEDKVITADAMVRGMIYLLGLDPEFKHRDEYIKFLYAVNPQIEDYINYEAIRFVENGNAIEAIIFLKSLVSLNNNKNTNYTFNYALTLIQYAVESLESKPKVQATFRKEAMTFMKLVLDENEGFALAYYHLGYLHLYNKEYNQAKFHWDRYLDFDDDSDLAEEVNQMLLEIEDHAKYESGYESILAGRPEDGLPLLLELEERSENWWNLLFFIGLAYRQLMEYEDAIIYFKKVLEIEEEQVDALVELGLCYGAIRDYGKALESFEMALNFAGENPEILCNMAMVYMETGELLLARKHLDHSLRLNSEDEVTKICDRQLRELMEVKKD